MKTINDYKLFIKKNPPYPLVCCKGCGWFRECWEVGCGPQPYCQELMLLNGFSKYRKRTTYQKDKRNYFIIENWDGTILLSNYGAIYMKCQSVTAAEDELRKICGRLPRKIEEENYEL